jgi:hypothetical protein
MAQKQKKSVKTTSSKPPVGAKSKQGAKTGQSVKKSSAQQKKPSQTSKKPVESKQNVAQSWKPEAPGYSIKQPLPSEPLFTPLNIFFFIVGLGLFGSGAYIFYSIQYLGLYRNLFLQGFLLFVAGLLIPCIFVPRLRHLLLPRKDVTDTIELVPTPTQSGARSKTQTVAVSRKDANS